MLIIRNLHLISVQSWIYMYLSSICFSMCFSPTGENDHVMNNQTAPSGGISDVVMSEEEMRKQRKLDQKKRHGIVLWRRPIVTFTYFCFEMAILLHDYKER